MAENPPKWGWEGVSAAYLVPGVQADSTDKSWGYGSNKLNKGGQVLVDVMTGLKNRGMRP